MPEQPRGREVVFRHSPTGEAIIIAAALCSGERADAWRKDAARKYPPDSFLTPEHAVIWKAVREAERRGLPPDPATLVRLSSGAIDITYLVEVMGARPDMPDDRTLAFQLEQLAWDRQKYVAVTGPIDGLLDAIQKNEPPERVRGLARAVASSFDGWGDRRHLLEPELLVREQVVDLRERMAGRALYPYGLDGLDSFEPLPGGGAGPKRMIPGAKPGQTTVVTGVPGSGKSSLVTRIALGLAQKKRRVLFGAWEMTGGTTLELLACMSLGWSRSALTAGAVSEEELARLEERMRQLARRVRFLGNPFRRGDGGKPSNARNLDAVHGYLADSGCDVFIADLWKRCLVEARPEDEEEALYRQQAMAEELGVHVILVQQQRLKDIELRPDKRPTREGIKGSGAWTEIADTILGVHRPALWKPVTDNVLEIDVLKQRYGKWPLAVEHDWDADRGMISGGRSVDYEMQGGRGEGNPIDDKIREPKKRGGR